MIIKLSLCTTKQGIDEESENIYIGKNETSMMMVNCPILSSKMRYYIISLRHKRHENWLCSQKLQGLQPHNSHRTWQHKVDHPGPIHSTFIINKKK